jgi:hypothetical protein
MLTPWAEGLPRVSFDSPRVPREVVPRPSDTIPPPPNPVQRSGLARRSGRPRAKSATGGSVPLLIWPPAELFTLAATRGRVIVFAASIIIQTGQHLAYSRKSLRGHAAVALLTGCEALSENVTEPGGNRERTSQLEAPSGEGLESGGYGETD